VPAIERCASRAARIEGGRTERFPSSPDLLFCMCCRGACTVRTGGLMRVVIGK
jgi:hypothetical protein